jgi:group I intron endonuclease
MLASWQKYGEEVFLFEVIEVVDDAIRLLEAEQKHLDAHASKDYCFNWALYAGAPMRGRSGEGTPNFGKTFSQETRQKISAAFSGEKHRNWGKKLSEETKEKIRASNLLYPHKDRKHTPEAIEKIAAAGKGRPVSAETRAKRSAALKGREIPLEQRIRISATLSGEGNFWYGKKRPDHSAKVSKVIDVYKDGVLLKTFDSIQALRIELDLKPPTVNRALKSGVPISKGRLAGYSFFYKKV